MDWDDTDTIVQQPNWYQDKDWQWVNVIQTPQAVYIDWVKVYSAPKEWFNWKTIKVKRYNYVLSEEEIKKDYLSTEWDDNNLWETKK